MSEQDSTSRYKIGTGTYLLLFLCVALPYWLIYATPFEEWKMRTLASACFNFTIPLAAIIYGLHPKSNMFNDDPSVKVTEEHRRKYGPVIRAGAVFFALSWFYYFSWPLSKDVADLISGHKPLRVTGRVNYRSDVWGSYYFHQTFRIASKGKYTLLYFPAHRMERGDQVEVSALPNSRIVVSVHSIIEGR